MFNLMFKTFVGPVEDDASQVYLRPETAQGMFVNFENVLTTTRRKLPFGIAQIGRAFRNEITPGNFIFRDREFEQMEMEYFVLPGTDEEWHDRWIEDRLNWWLGLGVRKENLQLRDHAKEELSHYSKRTVDIEYDFPFAGFSEIEGIANRTDFDLKKHAEFAGRTLQYFDEATGQQIVPYVIEPAMGVDRCFLTVIIDSYAEEEVQRREAGPPPPQAGTGADQGRRPPALPQREARAARAPGLGPAAPPLHDAVRRRPEHRPPLPAPGRDRHSLLRHDRLRDARGRSRHDPRAGLDGADTGADREPGSDAAGEAGGKLMAARQRRPLNYLVDSEGRVKGVIVPINEYREMRDGRVETRGSRSTFRRTSPRDSSDQASVESGDLPRIARWFNPGDPVIVREVWRGKYGPSARSPSFVTSRA